MQAHKYSWQHWCILFPEWNDSRYFNGFCYISMNSQLSDSEDHHRNNLLWYPYAVRYEISIPRTLYNKCSLRDLTLEILSKWVVIVKTAVLICNVLLNIICNMLLNITSFFLILLSMCTYPFAVQLILCWWKHDSYPSLLWNIFHNLQKKKENMLLYFSVPNEMQKFNRFLAKSVSLECKHWHPPWLLSCSTQWMRKKTAKI